MKSNQIRFKFNNLSKYEIFIVLPNNHYNRYEKLLGFKSNFKIVVIFKNSKNKTKIKLHEKGIFMRSLTVLFCILLVSCTQLTTMPSRKEDSQKMTLGFIQSKIKMGSSDEEVILLLETPNIITNSDNNSETWIYDKISSETEKSSFLTNEISVKSTRSLIVVIKFDSNKKVISTQYRQSTY